MQGSPTTFYIPTQPIARRTLNPAEQSLQERKVSSVKTMNLEASSIIAVSAICSTVLLAILNKWWDPVAAHVGYPFGVRRRLKLLGDQINQLSAIKRDVEYSDPSPSSNSLYRSALREELWCTVEKAWVSQKDTSRWRQWSSEARFPKLKMLVAQHVFSLQFIQFFQNITFLELEGVPLIFSEKGKTQASSSIDALDQSDNSPWDIICELVELQHLNLSATSLGSLPQLLEKLSKLEYLFGTGACYEVLQELASSTIDLQMLGFTVRTVGEITKLAQLETVCTQALCMHHVQDKNDPDIINLKFLSKLRELRELAIVQSFDSQKVLEAEGGPESDYYQQLLPELEILELNNLLKLKYLEQLTVAQCKNMEVLIEIGESSQDVGMNQMAKKSFPRLQKLTLEELPKLSMISQQACQFEDLSCISVTRCNEMKYIHDQEYKQLINIHCSEDWWTESKPAGTSNPYLVPTFFSKQIRQFVL